MNTGIQFKIETKHIPYNIWRKILVPIHNVIKSIPKNNNGRLKNNYCFRHDVGEETGRIRFFKK